MESARSRFIQLKPSLKKSLEQDILKFWLNKTVDQENGGFYGYVGSENMPDPYANKGVILNTRILWSFSAVNSIIPDEKYRKHARRAYEYIINHFADKKHGGVFWELDYTGKPVNSRKQIYAQSFAIYSFSEYFRITGDSKVLDQAIEIYHLIEKYSLDRTEGGYKEAFREDWTEIGDFRLSEKDLNAPKTMNTHLHILEAYTSLYRIWPDRELKTSLRNLILLFIKKFIDNRGHLVLFFSNSWEQIGDFCSYGHDIEFSWLLTEAAHALGEKDLVTITEEKAVRIADMILKEGADSDGGLMNEYHYSKNELDGDKHWWIQAEAMVGYYNAFQITGNEKYLDSLLKQWEFIEKHIIDHNNGEWFWKTDRAGKVYPGDEKAGFWKCPYHNTRAIIELLERP
jgi:cellobiose epimerase